MSRYSDISKSIGWDAGMGSETIPSVRVAVELVERAVKGDEQAFTKLFRINRFARSPGTEVERVAIGIVSKGLAEARPLFE